VASTLSLAMLAGSHPLRKRFQPNPLAGEFRQGTNGCLCTTVSRGHPSRATHRHPQPGEQRPSLPSLQIGTILSVVPARPASSESSESSKCGHPHRDEVRACRPGSSESGPAAIGSDPLSESALRRSDRSTGRPYCASGEAARESESLHCSCSAGPPAERIAPSQSGRIRPRSGQPFDCAAEPSPRRKGRHGREAARRPRDGRWPGPGCLVTAYTCRVRVGAAIEPWWVAAMRIGERDSGRERERSGGGKRDVEGDGEGEGGGGGDREEREVTGGTERRRDGERAPGHPTVASQQRGSAAAQRRTAWWHSERLQPIHTTSPPPPPAPPAPVNTHLERGPPRSERPRPRRFGAHCIAHRGATPGPTFPHSATQRRQSESRCQTDGAA
jgi:hypothetical protein